jgi:hypothetical protein
MLPFAPYNQKGNPSKEIHAYFKQIGVKYYLQWKKQMDALASLSEKFLLSLSERNKFIPSSLCTALLNLNQESRTEILNGLKITFEYLAHDYQYNENSDMRNEATAEFFKLISNEDYEPEIGFKYETPNESILLDSITNAVEQLNKVNAEDFAAVTLCELTRLHKTHQQTIISNIRDSLSILGQHLESEDDIHKWAFKAGQCNINFPYI